MYEGNVIFWVLNLFFVYKRDFFFVYGGNGFFFLKCLFIFLSIFIFNSQYYILTSLLSFCYDTHFFGFHISLHVFSLEKDLKRERRAFPSFLSLSTQEGKEGFLS